MSKVGDLTKIKVNPKFPIMHLSMAHLTLWHLAVKGSQRTLNKCHQISGAVMMVSFL